MKKHYTFFVLMLVFGGVGIVVILKAKITASVITQVAPGWVAVAFFAASIICFFVSAHFSSKHP